MFIGRERILICGEEADRENPRRSRATLRIFAGRLTKSTEQKTPSNINILIPIQ